MKKLIYILLLIPAVILAQGKTTTTEEEYNYLLNGFKLQLENGGDMKAGYDVVKNEEIVTDNFTTTSYFLKELASNKVKAILYIMKRDKKTEKNTYYFCVPFNNPILYEKFLKDVEGTGIVAGFYFDKILCKDLSKYASQALNHEH